MTARPFGYHTKQFLEFVIEMTMVILKAKNVEILPLVWQFGRDQASVLHVGLPPRIFMFEKDYQMLMVCSELNYHISQNHIYLNRNIFCLNCHGLLVLLVRVISSLCIETHKVESAKEIKRSAKEIWDRNGMKESHEIVQVSPSRSVFFIFIQLKIFLSQTIRLFILISQGYLPQ